VNEAVVNTMPCWAWVIIATFFLLAIGTACLYSRWRYGIDKRYYEHTETCPTCKGRGRVPKEGWEFVDSGGKQ